MKNKFWLIVFQFLLFSCTNLNPEPPVHVENGFVNEQIKLVAPSEYNSFKTSDAVIFEVEYYSNNEVVVPNNYNVRIFKQSDNVWTELSEMPILRYPEGDIFFSPEKNGLQNFAVEPKLDDYAQNYDLRFYIFGNMKTNDGVKQVSAYVDVKLHP